MTPALLMLLAATAAGGHSHAGGLAMFEWGKDPAPGLLVNHSAGARPWDPIDPAKPTFAIAPGLNPLHPLLKVTVAQRYGEQLSRRYGSSVNIVGWDWNGNSMHGLKARVNDELALRHGYAFATALRKAGAAPGKLHMIGQSAGCVVAAAAARALAAWHGQPVDRLTLIDPVVGEHPLIFGRLAAGSAAAHVEHFWAPGPSGYGQNAPYPGVRNASVPGPNGFKGVIHPLHSDHLHAVQWHIRQLTR